MLPVQAALPDFRDLGWKGASPGFWQLLPPLAQYPSNGGRMGLAATTSDVVTSLVIEKTGDTLATSVTLSDSVTVRATGAPGLQNLKALLYNPDHLVPPGAGANSTLGTVVNLGQVSVAGSVATYEGTVSVSSLTDNGGENIPRLQGAVRHFKKGVVSIGAGYTDPATLTYSADPQPLVLSDTFSVAGNLNNQYWTAAATGTTSQPPQVQASGAEFPFSDGAGNVFFKPANALFPVNPDLVFAQASIGMAPPGGGAAHQEVLSFVLYANNQGPNPKEGYSIVLQSDGLGLGFNASIGYNFDLNSGQATTFVPLGVNIPAGTATPMKIEIDSVAGEARFYIWDGATLLLRYTKTGLPALARESADLLFDAQAFGTVGPPFSKFFVDDVQTTLRQQGNDYLISISPLSLDGLVYDSLNMLGDTDKGLLYSTYNGATQGFPAAAKTGSNRVFAHFSNDQHAALITMTPNTGSPFRLTLLTRNSKAQTIADLSTPPPGFTSSSVDRFVEGWFLKPTAPTGNFTHSTTDFGSTDANDPPAPVGANPTLTFSGAQYQMTSPVWRYQGKTYSASTVVAGANAAFLVNTTPTIEPVTGAAANVTATGTTNINLALLSSQGNNVVVLTPLSQADVGVLLGPGDSVVRFDAGVLVANGAGNAYTYAAPTNPVTNPVTDFFNDPLAVMSSTNTLTVVPPDNTSPSIAITAPTAGQIFSVNTVNVAATLSDNVGVNAASGVARLDGTNVTAQAVFTTTTATLPLAGVGDGAHTVTLDVNDTAGNTATQASVTFTVDTTAPVVALTSHPVNTTVNTANITLTGTVVEAGSGLASLTVNGAGVTVNGGNFSSVQALESVVECT